MDFLPVDIGTSNGFTVMVRGTRRWDFQDGKTSAVEIDRWLQKYSIPGSLRLEESCLAWLTCSVGARLVVQIRGTLAEVDAGT
jgi:hypothetical protein